MVSAGDYAKHVTTNLSNEIKKLKEELKKSKVEKSDALYDQRVFKSAIVVVVHAMEETITAWDDVIAWTNSWEFERDRVVVAAITKTEIRLG